jgi:hypothetical protein
VDRDYVLEVWRQLDPSGALVPHSERGARLKQVQVQGERAERKSLWRTFDVGSREFFLAGGAASAGGLPGQSSSLSAASGGGMLSGQHLQLHLAQLAELSEMPLSLIIDDRRDVWDERAQGQVRNV